MILIRIISHRIDLLFLHSNIFSTRYLNSLNFSNTSLVISWVGSIVFCGLVTFTTVGLPHPFYIKGGDSICLVSSQKG